MAEKKNLSIALKLMISSALSVLIAVMVMTMVFTFFLNQSFKDYILQEKKETRNELVRSLTEQMKMDSSIDQEWMQNFSAMYMEKGLFITLKNSEGDQMWSCMEDNSSICSMHMDENDPDFFEKMETESYKVSTEKNTDSYFSLNISFDPGGEYSENEQFFLTESFKLLLLSMIISLIVASLASFVLSRSLSRPLEAIAAYALRLSNHDYQADLHIKEGTKEIDALHSAIEQLAGALESQEKLRKRLTSDVSHELRTPLTKIQSSLEAMIDGIWPRDEERLESCHKEILRLTGLVSELDDLNRYDSETGTLTMQTVNLRESLLYVLKIFEQDCRDRNITMTLKLKETWIQGDEVKLKQVWINLISNALKFTDDHGEITITMTKDNPVIISIADTGIGIDSRDLPNIFERFYKGDLSRNKNGSGLGLSIVKEIINLHNGSVTAESRKGAGSVFRVQLPLNQ